MVPSESTMVNPDRNNCYLRKHMDEFTTTTASDEVTITAMFKLFKDYLLEKFSDRS
ncbi:hypothetical protein J437_LFUL002717 [Ladona fulva]|uniref:Uncharacterized protein n=1 Tax=Ladona fulva TaxID=123851 RepID=A0A8K0NYK5_LADFU|nr:hypothetical protein J437_LFUL002717 [Ladona fulva]